MQGYDVYGRWYEETTWQGFPDGYHFAGTRTDTVRQIGTAVSVNLAEALCSAVLS